MLCSLRDMRSSKPPDDTANGHRRIRSRMEPGKAALETAPRLWPQLSVEERRRLAQHLGQLLQRLRPLNAEPEGGHCVDHDVVER
jgi:hypothetical protein